jgi:hypothetical protein
MHLALNVNRALADFLVDDRFPNMARGIWHGFCFSPSVGVEGRSIPFWGQNSAHFDLLGMTVFKLLAMLSAVRVQHCSIECSDARRSRHSIR